MLSNTHFSMAVHVLSALAYHRGEVLGSEDLARTVGTNPSFLRGLIGQLKAAGLVETRLGKGGGAMLAQDPERITLKDVYAAVESSPVFKTHPCKGDDRCPVAEAMQRLLAGVEVRLQTVLEQELMSMTIGDLVATHVGKEA